MGNIFTLQGDVSDLTVTSDSTQVTKGSGLTGRIEIWPRNYAPAGGNSSYRYDNGDTQWGDGDYGSFQLHSAVPSTIFAWNRHGAGAEIGFGTSPGTEPDWTFATNGGSISNFSFESYANHPVTTPALSISSRTNLAAGVVGLPLSQQPSVQILSNGVNLALAGVTIQASISAGASLSGTTTAVTNAQGIATFSDLGFATGTVGTSYTMSFAAAGYTSAGDSLQVRALPTQVTVSTSPSSANGSFVNGFWMTTSAAATTINTTDLQNELISRSVTIRSTDWIVVNNAVSGAGNTGRHLSFITVNDIAFGASVANTNNISISASRTYYGGGAITSSAGSITITAGTNIEPSGNLSASGNVSLTATGMVYLNNADVTSSAGNISVTAGPVENHGILVRSAAVSAPQGSITMTGRSTSLSGVAIYEQSNISSTSGAISITGIGTDNTTSHGVDIYDASIISTTSGSVTATGTLAGGAAQGIALSGGATISSTSGNVQLSGSGGTDWGVWAAGASIVSTSGTINLDGGTGGIANGVGATTHLGANAAGTASGNITVRGDRYWGGTTAANYKTTGAVVIESLATQFPADTTLLNHSFIGNSSLKIGRATNATALTLSGGSTSIVGPIAIHGALITVDGNLVTSGANGTILLKSTSTIAVGASRTLQTNGADIVLWGGSAGGDGNFTIGNSACINTNASCEVSSNSTSGGNIYMGGGAAGTTHPTGPIVNTSSLNAISFGTGINSGINVLSGGGNIEIRGTSNVNGVSAWSGFTLKATTGSITLVGTSSGTAQGVRIAASGTSTIESAKTNGDAITIIGNNTSNSVVANTNGIGIGYAATQVNISATGGGDVRLQGTVTNQGNVASYFNNTNVSTTGSGNITVTASGAFTSSGTGTFVSAGNTSVTASGITLGSTITAGGTSGVLLKSDEMAINADVSANNASGAVTISPLTNNLQIDLGTETSGRLSLVDAELDRLIASVVRIGEVGGANSGTINVTAALTPGGTNSLALRTSGSVIGTDAGSITETNLAIHAAVVNLPGNNSITGNLALVATGGTITYNQTSGPFTPNTVDSITPVYGVPSKVVLSDVPTNQAIDKFMAVKFEPPPVATLQDSYNKTLTTANASADDYTITATKASGPGNISGTTQAVTTSTTGVATFSDLSISDTAGAHTIIFTVSVTPNRTAQISGTPTATTGTYNIKIDQTVSFTSTAPANARATGASYTATATATSSLTPVITVDSSAAAVCSISSGVVTFQSAGT
jgi:hypothetical protein